MPDDVLTISMAADRFAAVIVDVMEARGLDGTGWQAGIAAELYSAATDTAACMVYAQGGAMA